ncbi:hypothetical protein MKX08_009890 [Trichoderma sp. CBMAI-0020]|nr:hypothetical protein MKX08_009890 [Trichoderma sp. CBMAI-0020]
MSNSNFGCDRVVSLFAPPTNIPASMSYRRDRRNGRWWASGSPNRKFIFAAGIMLIAVVLFAIATSYFLAPDPLVKLLLSGHKDGSRAMATNMHERRFKWQDRFKKQRGNRNPVKTCIGLFVFFGFVIMFTILAVLDRKYQFSRKMLERQARRWVKLKQRWSRLRHGNQAAETQGDEESGQELRVLQNEAAADAPKDETQTVVRPVEQTPAPQNDTSPSSADVTQNEPQEAPTSSSEPRFLANDKALQRSFSGPSSRTISGTISKPNSKSHGRVKFKTDTKASLKIKTNANIKIEMNASFKTNRNANVNTDRNANVNTDRNANVKVGSMSNFPVKSNANLRIIGNLNIMAIGNANSQVSSNTNTKASNRASNRASTKTMIRSRKRMKGL